MTEPITPAVAPACAVCAFAKKHAVVIGVLAIAYVVWRVYANKEENKKA